jgi:hypothetical protein
MTESNRIEDLLAILEREPLDPSFEAYGNFIVTIDIVLDVDEVQFFGDFANVSHVFDVRTKDAVLIRQLTNAIRANQRTAAYRKARDERKTSKVRRR